MSTSTATASLTTSKPLPCPPTSAPLIAPPRSQWPSLPTSPHPPPRGQYPFLDSPHPDREDGKRPFSTFPRPRPRPNNITLPNTPRSPPSHIVMLPSTPQGHSRHLSSSPKPSPRQFSSPQPSPRHRSTSPQPSPRHICSSPQPASCQIPPSPQVLANQYPTTPRSPPSHIMLLPSPPTSPPSQIVTHEKRLGFLFPPLILNVNFEEDKVTSNADDIFTPISPSIQEIEDPLVHGFVVDHPPAEEIPVAADPAVIAEFDEDKVTRTLSVRKPSMHRVSNLKGEAPKPGIGRTTSLRLLSTWKSRGRLRGDEEQKAWI